LAALLVILNFAAVVSVIKMSEQMKLFWKANCRSLPSVMLSGGSMPLKNNATPRLPSP